MTVVDLHPRTLGGSQMANAIGVGWQSPIRTFGEITGKPGFAREETAAMRLGRKLQPVVFSELEEAGWAVVEYDVLAATGKTTAFRDPARPWLVGHPDGAGFDQHDGLVVEAKTQIYPHADLSAQVQLLTYMHLGGYSGGLLATLAGLHLDVQEVERNERYIEEILTLAERFWQYVEADEWPPVTGHSDDTAALRVAFADAARGKTVRETREIRDARRELALMKAADGKHGARTRRKAYLEGVLTSYMGDADTLISLHDEKVASWPMVERRSLDTAALRKEQPTTYAAYTVVNRTRRFSLS